MEPNLKHPQKKMGKNDERVDAQVDTPTSIGNVQDEVIKKTARFFNLKTPV